MTLIARMRFGGAPLYIGDAMLSVFTNRHLRQVSVPAYKDINERLSDDAWGYARGLRQKLNVLGEGDLLVAWAGSELQARIALRELEEASNAGARTVQDFFDVLGTKPANELNDLTLLGTKISREEGEERSLVANWAINCAQKTILDIDCRVAGSGAATFEGMLPALLSNPPMAVDDHSQMSRAWQVAMVAAGRLIGHEVHVGENLNELWGGAFEAAYISDHKIAKVTDTLHSFWGLERLNERQASLVMLLKLLKYEYVGQDLVVHVLDIPIEGPAEGSMHVVSPLLHPSSVRPAKPNFAHLNLTCHIMLLPNEEGVVENVTLVKTNVTSASITAELTQENTSIQIADALFDEIRTWIQPRCPLEVV